VVRVLFLGGLGRSGTTLLERMLGRLPGVCPLGEVVHLWQRDLVDDERCGCGTRFSGCGFWQRVGREAFGGWDRIEPRRILQLQHTVERTRHIPWLASRAAGSGTPRAAQVSEYAGYYERVYRAAAAVTGAHTVVDSSKHSALAFCLRHAPAIDLRVIHLVRDSRGVAYSWTKRVARPEAGDAAEMTRYAPSRAALLWNAHNAAFDVLGRCGVPVQRMRYEQLVADPRAELRIAARFAEIETSTVDFAFLRPDHGRFVADLRPTHSAAGNPMRFTVGPVEVRRDDAWQDALPAAQRRLVGALTAPLLSAYGYPLLGAAA
jgi:Sulfotransferase family